MASKRAMLGYGPASARVALAYVRAVVAFEHRTIRPHIVDDPSYRRSASRVVTVELAIDQIDAMQSISTSEFPGMPPAAAIVVLTGGSAPKRP